MKPIVDQLTEIIVNFLHFSYIHLFLYKIFDIFLLNKFKYKLEDNEHFEFLTVLTICLFCLLHYLKLEDTITETHSVREITQDGLHAILFFSFVFMQKKCQQSNFSDST